MSFRKVDLYDQCIVSTNCNVQVALKVENAKCIPSFIEEIQNSMLAFRTRIVGNRIETTDKVYDILSLPKNIKTMKDMCNWTVKNRYPNDKTLGTLAVNDEYIVFNSHHVLADGHALTNLVHRLANGVKSEKVTGLPISIYDVFDKEIKEAPNQKEYFDNSKKAQVFPLREYQKCKKVIDSVDAKIPFKELMAYDNNTGKLHRLSEAFWTASILSGFTLNNNFGKASIITVIDLRQFMKTKSSLHNVNMWSHIYEYAEPNINDDIETLYDKLRNDYNDNIAKGRQFTFMKEGGIKNPKTSFVVEVSSVGSVHIKPPIVDAYLNLYNDLSHKTQLINDTFSIIGNGKNDMHISTAFPPNIIRRNEIERYNKMFQYTLRNISPKMRIKDALDELQKIK